MEESPYEAIELPEFKSQIPEALLKNATDQEKWVMNTLSRHTLVLDFLLQTVVHLSKNLKLTDQTAIVASAKVRELEGRIDKIDVRLQAVEEAKKTCERRKDDKEKGKFRHELRDFVSLLAWRPFQLFMLVLIVVGALLGPTGLMAVWKFVLGAL